MSNQRPLTEAEKEIEHALQEYMQRKTSCRKAWYQKWLPLFFPAPCEFQVTCYSGFELHEAAVPNSATAVTFLVRVTEQDTASVICAKDSAELKKDARYFARKLRPVLQGTDAHDWIEVEYSTYVTKDRSMSYAICERSIQFAVSDTANWALAPLRTTNSTYRSHPINNWEEKE